MSDVRRPKVQRPTSNFQRKKSSPPAQGFDPVDFARILADPTRQQIMECCCCEWKNVNEMVDAVKVSQPTVSHHLAVLRDAGLVSARDQGKHTFYMLNQEKVAFCCGQLITTFAPETRSAELIQLKAVK